MTQPDLFFLVDGGASKTETELRRADGRLLARHRAGPCNLYQNPQGGIAAIESAWAACSAGLGPDAAAQTAISAGLAGLSGEGARALFHQAFARFAARSLSSDGYTSLVGAFGASPGAVLAIGTGAVGGRFSRAGAFTQLGGWGFLAGDRGGGAWLGLQLVAEYLEHLDGTARLPASAALWQAVEARLGTGRGTILSWLRAASPGDFAALVPDLLAQARSGCALSQQLIRDAAAHLARLAQALAGPERLELVLTGGLAAPLAPALAHALAAGGLAVSQRPASALEGALHIARGVRPPEFAD